MCLLLPHEFHLISVIAEYDRNIITNHWNDGIVDECYWKNCCYTNEKTWNKSYHTPKSISAGLDALNVKKTKLINLEQNMGKYFIKSEWKDFSFEI